MASYAFWNNKGGVGKSFLVFISACEYAHKHPGSDVYVIDLCPQANVSETLLGGYQSGAKALNKLRTDRPRRTISGYLDARLNSPFVSIRDIDRFICKPSHFNDFIPHNVQLICGDNLLEIQSDAIRQTSQLTVPDTAWKQVISWVHDLALELRARSNGRDSVILIDCNPSFAIFTQMAIVATDDIVVPFTADDSSRRGIENVVALLFGIGDDSVATYSRISFSSRAVDDSVKLPTLHTFISNRVTLYKGEPSSAFRAVSQSIKKLMNELHRGHRQIFSNPARTPGRNFLSVPDYHSACVVATTLGKPLHRLKPGLQQLGTEQVQLNRVTLEPYREALEQVVDRL